MPANRKRPDQRGDNRDGRAPVLDLIAGGAERPREIPPMPDHPDASEGEWRAQTVQRWEELWSSPVAGAIDPEADGGKLLRWVYAWDQWFRTAALISRTGPLTVGAKGTPVESPAVGYLERQEKVIAAVEKEFGLGPLARNNLGVMIGQHGLTVDELNRRIRAADLRAIGDEEGADAVLELDGVRWGEA